MSVFGFHRRTSYRVSSVAIADAPDLAYRLRSSGNDAIVRALSHTQAHTADSVSAVSGVTVWPVLPVAALTGGFALPPIGQKVSAPKRIPETHENMPPKNAFFFALGCTTKPAACSWRISFPVSVTRPTLTARS